jgi:hypothetical protein
MRFRHIGEAGRISEAANDDVGVPDLDIGNCAHAAAADALGPSPTS